MTTLAEELRRGGKSVLLSFSAAEFVPVSALRDEEDVDMGKIRKEDIHIGKIRRKYG